MTTTTTSTENTTTVSLVALEKALIAMKKAYDKARVKPIDLETEKGIRAKANNDAILSAQENIVLAMIKNNYTVTLDAKAYYDLVMERLDVSKASEFPVLDHEGKVLDFLHEVSVKMLSSRNIVIRFWNMTKRVLSLTWYYTGRYVVNGLVYVWDKMCDLWTWIKSKFSKDAPAVAPVATPVAPVAPATPVAIPVTEQPVEATEVVVEVAVEAVVEEVATVVTEELTVADVEEAFASDSSVEEVTEVAPAVEAVAEVVVSTVVSSEEVVAPVAVEAAIEVASDEIPVISDELLETIEGDLLTSTDEELDSDIIDEVVASEVVEVAPVEAVTVEAVEVAPVVAIAEAMPSALAAGAPAVKAPNTKVNVSRPGNKSNGKGKKA
jgi:hypothetical protein